MLPIDITSLPEFYRVIFNDSATKVLNYSTVGIFAVQGYLECQPCGPRDNHIIDFQNAKADEQLLILINRVSIVGDDHRLPHTFDAQWLAEYAMRLKLASVWT